MLSWAENRSGSAGSCWGFHATSRCSSAGFPVGMILAQVPPALNKRESGRCRMQKEIKIDRRLRKMEFFGGIMQRSTK